MANPYRSNRKQSSGLGVLLFRFIAFIVLPLALVYGFLWWRADTAIEKALERARSFVNIERSSTVLGLDGDIGITKLVMTPKDGASLPKVEVQADRVVVQTPGLWWLVRSSVFGMRKEIPSRIGVQFDGVHVEGSDSELRKIMSGKNILFPFDLAGCEPEMTPAILRELGGETVRSSFELTMTHPRESELRLSVNANTPDLVKTEGEIDLALGAGEPTLQMATAGVQNIRVVYTDLGFVAKRNAYCAKRTGLAPDAFVAAHVDAAGKSFAPMGLKPGAALTQSYAGFSKDGGQMTIVARPLKPMPLAGLQGINLGNLNLYLDASVRHNDAFAGALSFLQVETGPGAPATATASMTTPAVPGAAPPSAGYTKVALGQEIPYDRLIDYVGDDIEVSTNINTVRKGVLLGSSSMGVSLKLPASEGGYNLSLPKYTVSKVLLVKPLAAAGASANAKR
jgi:hypothetical protein